MVNKPKQKITHPRLRHAKSFARVAGKQTWQEGEIAHALEDLQIDYTLQAPFLIQEQEIIVDFLLKSPRGIPVAIECSQTTGPPSVLRKKGRYIDSRFRFLKTTFCMGTVACLYLPSVHGLRQLFRELRNWMNYTDVLISNPGNVWLAVITAGEKVFEALATKSLRPEKTKGLPDDMEEVWREEM